MNRSGQAEIKHKFYKATKEFVVIALYLWLIFGLFAIYRSVILAEDHVSIPEESFALIKALVFGKVVLAARKLHLGNFVDDAPLVYPTLVAPGKQFFVSPCSYSCCSSHFWVSLNCKESLARASCRNCFFVSAEHQYSQDARTIC